MVINLRCGVCLFCFTYILLETSSTMNTSLSYAKLTTLAEIAAVLDTLRTLLKFGPTCCGGPLSSPPQQCGNSSGRTLSAVTTASFSNCPGTDLCFGFLIYELQSTLQDPSGTVRPPKLSV